VSVTVAPGGVGKSALTMGEAVAMATGRDLLGVMPSQRRRVWYINLEDGQDEIDRRVAAICLQYKIHPEELVGWLFTNSGRDAEINLAWEQRGDLEINKTTNDQLRAQILANEIDVLILDPFIRVHGVGHPLGGAGCL